MSWNKALPSTNEKLRTLSGVITPNWEAIEEGDDVGVANMLQMRSVQLDNRTGLAANQDPQTNAGTHYLYSKDDGAGTQEAYTKDSAGNVIQMTNDGKIGATDVDYEANSISFDGTITYDQDNVTTAWGHFASTGATVKTNGLTCTESGSVYTLTFDTPLTAAGTTPYAVLVTLQGTNLRSFPQVSAQTLTTFEVRLISTGLAKEKWPFFVMVMGGR